MTALVGYGQGNGQRFEDFGPGNALSEGNSKADRPQKGAQGPQSQATADV
eukprot:CAMPEP_0174350126 /NCGR_PEP_ID=MMETSP0811_2-20130205/7125_1 /TAXON_ID=73025 ORGANISM="Eutreptiella gymnastica-like, Strain CCMP1594" /NCGR_SAMPLE_ID=MMETSP0811_2 /ASSEMBLY_ACC=CAM_ASM_000667 /LENGTH=49 /DNA_ID=CAMNT_0015478155 /DNA_START=543 /DNA_END=693 /DNA_ORIENTATION=+